MNKKGARILISNSDPKNTNPNDNFFDNVYSSYKIKRVEANRMINCNGEGRDFEKVNRNVESIKIELNILNSLIGSNSIEDDF